MSVTEVDFGAKDRIAARRLSRLLSLVEAHEAAILDDPKKYFDMASDEIERLRAKFRAMEDALRPPMVCFVRKHDPISFQPMNTLVVRRDEYERLKAAAALIDGWATSAPTSAASPGSPPPSAPR